MTAYPVKTREEGEHLSRLLFEHGYASSIDATAKKIFVKTAVSGKRWRDVLSLFRRQQVVRKAADSNQSEIDNHHTLFSI